MKKATAKKLKLNRETIQGLSDRQMVQAQGAGSNPCTSIVHGCDGSCVSH